MTTADGTEVANLLQDRLNALTDLHLTLKHIHWNVVGPHFIAVHEMLDPQVEAVRAMADETAERIATLGVAPDRDARRARGRPHVGRLRHRSRRRHRAPRRARPRLHRGDRDHRKAIDFTEDPDPVTQDMLIGQAGQLELFHWFVRAHLESSGGELSTAGATHEETAAKKAGSRARR